MGTLVVGFSLLAAGYAAVHGRVAIELQAVTKAVPIWLLSLAVFRGHGLAGQAPRWIGAGLAVSSVGDIALDLLENASGYDMPEDLFFVLGLLSFLVAHVLYISGLRSGARPIPFAPKVLGGLGLYSLVLLVTLLPQVEPALRLPVVVYGAVLAAMAYCAMAKALPGTAQGAMFAACGSVSFLVSDSILALDRFRFAGALPGAKLLVMVTYYAAQLLIAVFALTRPGKDE